MRNSKLIAFIFLSIFLITLVSAQEFTDDARVIRFFSEVNQPVDITDRCIVSGDICPTTFNCTLTVINTATQENVVLDVNMSRVGSLYNFTINSTMNNQLGIFEDSITCTNGTNAGTNTFYHRITPSGAPPIDSGEGFTLIGTLIILILAIIVILTLGIFSRSVPISIFFVSLGVLLLVATIGFGFTITEELFGLYGDIVSSYGIFYRLLVILISGASILLMMYLVVVGLKSLQIKRGLRDEM